jgi:hypothetical protein
MRAGIAVLVILVVLVGGAEVSATTAGAEPLPGLACGQTITTSVRLRHDLTCPNGFVVDLLDCSAGCHPSPAVAMTIDLAGHTLAVPRSGRVTCAFEDPNSTCTIVDLSGVDLTLTNGTVVGDVGLSEQNYLPVAGHSLMSRVHVEGDTWLVADGAEIRDSRIDGQVHAYARTDTVRRNVILGGIRTSDTFNNLDLTITDNLIANSPDAGIELQDNYVRPDVAGLISGNIIYHSAKAGITSDGADLDHLLIAHNWLVDNGGAGITITDPQPPTAYYGSATLTANAAVANAGQGLVVTATGTYTDGGRNTASFNRTNPQCVGLTCQP